jgi:hypothetical protein
MTSRTKSSKKVDPRTTTAIVTHTPEADFNDTIAHNRSLPLLAPEAVPHRPQGFRPTDPEVRSRRLRRLSSDLRAEAAEALDEASGRDLKSDLGRFAPEPQRASALVARIRQTGELVARAQDLLQYAKEVDELALSDALLFLEAEKKQFNHSIEHDPSLVSRYRALAKLFAARSGAIAEGIARARTSGDAAPAAPAPAGVERGQGP